MACFSAWFHYSTGPVPACSGGDVWHWGRRSVYYQRTLETEYPESFLINVLYGYLATEIHLPFIDLKGGSCTKTSVLSAFPDQFTISIPEAAHFDQSDLKLSWSDVDILWLSVELLMVQCIGTNTILFLHPYPNKDDTLETSCW